MSKLVVLKLTKGNFEQGFQVILQIGEDGATPTTEITGYLPPAPNIPTYYGEWQLAHSYLNVPQRIKAKTQQVTNASIGNIAQLLSNSLKTWLNNSNSFRPIREKIYEKLHSNDCIRVLLQTQDTKLWQLPWQLWDFFDSYPLAELAVSTISYDQVTVKTTPRQKVRILAILGDSTGIDVTADRRLLENLPDADVVFLVEPARLELDSYLWDESGWDILFFAGHSNSEENSGRIYINRNESLTVEQLRNALKKSIQKGLKLAIFNSCDGLGLAQQLASLHIPQVIVMREPVPDKVAQEFLKYFLQAFASGQPLYLAFREARERLQGLESDYPYASWLPIIYQNLSQVPPTWQSLKGFVTKPTDQQNTKRGLVGVLLASVAVTAMVLGFRSLGILQMLEYKAFDQMLLLRPFLKKESPDSQIVVVEINNTDFQKEQIEIAKESKKALTSKSLSDSSLTKLLRILDKYQPAAIGLDIYRDSTTDFLPENLIGICKRPDPPYDNKGFPAPPGMDSSRVAFSDVVADIDGILRRQILLMAADSQEACQAEYSFSVLLALYYLNKKGIQPEFTPEEGYLKLGDTVFQPLNSQSPGFFPADSLTGNQILINYRSNHVDSISLYELLSGYENNQLPANFIKDKIILIGATHGQFDNKYDDKWTTPYPFSQGNNHITPGVFIQAQMISQIISTVTSDRSLLFFYPWWVDGLWVLGYSLTVGVIVWKSRSLFFQVIAIGTTSLVLWVGCFSLFIIQGSVLPFIPPFLAVVLTGGLVVIMIYKVKP